MTSTEFNLIDFLDTTITDEVCLVCALPLPDRKKLELELFDSTDKSAVAAQYHLQASDLRHHYDKCIIDRDSAIPKGQLMSQLLNQLAAFITELENFRIFINGERNPDSLKTYVAMFRELRQTVAELNKVDSPEYMAGQLSKLVIKPLIYIIVKSQIDHLAELRTSVRSCVAEDKLPSIDASFINCAKNWGQLASVQQKLTNLKLAELCGISPENL